MKLRDGEDLSAFAARVGWKMDTSFEVFLASREGRSSPAREDSTAVSEFRADSGDDDDDEEDDGEPPLSAAAEQAKMLLRKTTGSGWKNGVRVKDAGSSSGPSVGNVGPGNPQPGKSNRRLAARAEAEGEETGEAATAALREKLAEAEGGLDDLDIRLRNSRTAFEARCKPKARRDARSPAAASAASGPDEGEQEPVLSAAAAKIASDERKYGRAVRRASQLKGR
jgi:murein DD-endopeptidase MepM/ murein hydrolase activator NlpD